MIGEDATGRRIGRGHRLPATDDARGCGARGWTDRGWHGGQPLRHGAEGSSWHAPRQLLRWLVPQRGVRAGSWSCGAGSTCLARTGARRDHVPHCCAGGVLGFLFVVGAGFSGASFLDFGGQNIRSLIMALLALAALCCCLFGLYPLPPLPPDGPSRPQHLRTEQPPQSGPEFNPLMASAAFGRAVAHAGTFDGLVPADRRQPTTERAASRDTSLSVLRRAKPRRLPPMVWFGRLGRRATTRRVLRRLESDRAADLAALGSDRAQHPDLASPLDDREGQGVDDADDRDHDR